MNGAEHNDATRLAQAFSTEGMDRTPGDCPSDDELWASASGELNPAANEAIILHLARCGECSSIWRLAREILPSDHLSQPSVVSIGNRKRPQVWRRVLLPAAAAAVLIGVGLSTAFLLRNGPSSEPVYRQQDNDVTISASPDTRSLPRSACRLQWSAGPDGTRYDVIISDEELEILDTVKGLGEPEYTLAEEKISTSARELYWRVTAHLPGGRKLSSETFTTSIDDPASRSDR